MREFQTGLTVRSGWLSEQGQHAFENVLRPIAETDLIVTAVLSDKQRGLLPAVKKCKAQMITGRYHPNTK